MHLFWHCVAVQEFWTNLAQYINAKCIHVHNFHFTKDLVLFGICNQIKTDEILDLIILLAKRYIYNSKVNKILPSFTPFKYILYNRFCIEKKFERNAAAVVGRWLPYINMFMSLQYNMSINLLNMC